MRLHRRPQPLSCSAGPCSSNSLTSDRNVIWRLTQWSAHGTIWLRNECAPAMLSSLETRCWSNSTNGSLWLLRWDQGTPSHATRPFSKRFHWWRSSQWDIMAMVTSMCPCPCPPDLQINPQQPGQLQLRTMVPQPVPEPTSLLRVASPNLLCQAPLAPRPFYANLPIGRWAIGTGDPWCSRITSTSPCPEKVIMDEGLYTWVIVWV